MNSTTNSGETTSQRFMNRIRLYWRWQIRAKVENLWINRISDEAFIRWMYRNTFGREPDLTNPLTFNEKINYLKLHDRQPLYTRLADKIAVGEYVQEKGLGHLLNQNYATYERVEDIDLDALPDAFVLRVTHGSAMNVLCKDKQSMDWEVQFERLRSWLKQDFYLVYREWVYKNVRPRILASRYLPIVGKMAPSDFKFFCFNGEPAYVQVDRDRFEAHSRNLYDMDWRQLPVKYVYPNTEQPVPRPSNFDEMVEVSRTLAGDIPFVRVDLYSIEGRTVFGEMTFYPEAGFQPFEPPEWDEILGERLDLEPVKQRQAAEAA